MTMSILSVMKYEYYAPIPLTLLIGNESQTFFELINASKHLKDSHAIVRIREDLACGPMS